MSKLFTGIINETFRMQALPPGPDGLHEVIEVKF